MSLSYVYMCAAHKAEALIRACGAVDVEVTGCRCTVARVSRHRWFGWVAEHDEHGHGAVWGRTWDAALARAARLCRPGV